MKVAVLYQAAPAPAKNGILKPMKEGGYSDSGADMAFCLRSGGIDVILPEDCPDEKNNFHWVFPDTAEGIGQALSRGADTLWLNTVLFKGHPIESFAGKGLRAVGQNPQKADFYDDKYAVNRFLAEKGLPVAPQLLVRPGAPYEGPFPCVIKPIRGRGSQGVEVARSKAEYECVLEKAVQSGKYGGVMMAEPYLPGREITVSVLPGGECLPVVERFRHQNGIAPYSGNVPVSENSLAIPMEPELETLCRFCGEASRLLEARALIRIDGRQDDTGEFRLFDVNVKPNMTGASRPHRRGQDSLTLLAARYAGLSYFDLLERLLGFAWEI